MAPKRKREAAEARSRATASPRKRLREVCNARVLWQYDKPSSAAQIDPRLAQGNPRELLRRFLSPMDVKTFMREAWARRAVAVHGPVGRLRSLIDNFLNGLDLEALLQETPSERIHAWLRQSDSTRPLDSIAVDADAAVGLARSGAALYFRAPEELEALFVQGIAAGLGAGCAGRYPGDGKARGEIETFYASKGHVTGWHTDFQHNFSIQLRGSKRWKFKPGPVEHNVRALTPHYRTRSNYEQQMKLHHNSTPVSPDFRPPENFFEDAETVVLDEGDVLYHPAGIWHHVECLSDDSLSINASLSIATWADLISDAIRQVLWESSTLRAPIIGLTAVSASDHKHGISQRKAEELLNEARQRVANISAPDLLPPATRSEGADGPVEVIHVGSCRLGSGFKLRPTDKFQFSRLMVAVELAGGKSDEVADSDDDDDDDDDSPSGPSYALHANFGNEDAASWTRVILQLPVGRGRGQATQANAAMAWLCDRRLAARHKEERARQRSGKSGRTRKLGAFAINDLGVAVAARTCGFSNGSVKAGRSKSRAPVLSPMVARLVRVLCHFGYLQPDS